MDGRVWGTLMSVRWLQRVPLPPPRFKDWLLHYLGALVALVGFVLIAVGLLIESELDHPAVSTAEHVSHLLLLIGELCFPIGLISLLYEAMLRKQHIRILRDELKSLLDDRSRALFEQQMQGVQSSGLVAIHERQDPLALAERLRHAKKLVRTLTPGPMEPKEVIPNALRDLLATATDAKRKKLRIKMVLLAEDTPWRLTRYEEVVPSIKDAGGSSMKKPVTEYIARLRTSEVLSKKFGDVVSVGIFKGTHSIDIYQVDDTAFVGFYLHWAWAFNNVILEVKTEIDGQPTLWGEIIEREFQTIERLGITKVEPTAGPAAPQPTAA